MMPRSVAVMTLRPALLALGFIVATNHAALGQEPNLALVGGRILDGFGGPVIENGVVLIAGERIVALGASGDLAVPAGIEIISTEGMTVLPGLFDMHVHLQILGHGDYERWNSLYGDRIGDLVMPIAARQLLMSGVTSARRRALGQTANRERRDSGTPALRVRTVYPAGGVRAVAS